MKKRFLALLLAVVTVLAPGCGGEIYEEPSDNTSTTVKEKKSKSAGAETGGVTGDDWRTYRSYITFEWNGTDTIYASVYDDLTGMVLVADDDSYSPICDCIFPEPIRNLDTLYDLTEMIDVDGDGYDDLSVYDMDNGDYYNYVYIYSEQSGAFDFVEEYSGLTGVQQGNNALYNDSEFLRVAYEWYLDGDTSNASLMIIPDGTVYGYDADGSQYFEGYIEVTEDDAGGEPNGTMIYSIYDNDGNFITGFYDDNEAAVLTEFYTGQDGEEHYVRSDFCN